MSKQSSADVVFEALCQLHNNEQLVTRQVLEEATGLKRGIVDNCIKALIEQGLVARLIRGIYIPCKIHQESRPVSRTILRDGSTIIEVGDDILNLTPAECRTLARMLHGDSVAFTNIQAGYALSTLMKDVGEA